LQAVEIVAGAVQLDPVEVVVHKKLSVVFPLSQETLQVSPTAVLAQEAVTELGVDEDAVDGVPTVNDDGQLSEVDTVEPEAAAVVAAAVADPEAEPVATEDEASPPVHTPALQVPVLEAELGFDRVHAVPSASLTSWHVDAPPAEAATHW